MAEKNSRPGRRFHAHETARVDSLNQRLLAVFWQRALAYAVDLLVATVVFAPLEFVWQRYVEHKDDITIKVDLHEWQPHRYRVVLRALYLLREWKDGREVDRQDSRREFDPGSSFTLAGDGACTGLWCFGVGGRFRICAVLHQPKPAVCA